MRDYIWLPNHGLANVNVILGLNGHNHCPPLLLGRDSIDNLFVYPRSHPKDLTITHLVSHWNG